MAGKYGLDLVILVGLQYLLILLDRNAFRAENPDATDVRETQVQLPPLNCISGKYGN